MDAQLEQRIEFFFMDPETDPNIIPNQPARGFSVLYLLRRDYHSCVKQGIYLFPAVMTMFAGIDLLGKFYAGDNSNGGVGQRFRSFIKQYFADTNAADADVIYRFRNAIMHSFGLYDEGYFFGLAQSRYGKIIDYTSDKGRVLGAIELHNSLEQAIDRYHSHLIASPQLQQNFDKMFGLYGTTSIGVGAEGSSTE